MAEFKGTREAFAAALYEMAAENDKVVGVFPDSLKAMRAVPFGETYPDRYIECGIAEQCAVDVAADLLPQECFRSLEPIVDSLP